MTIRGKNVYLEGGRIVFVGVLENGDLGVAFRGYDGTDSKLRMSAEAGEALRGLLAAALDPLERVVQWDEDFPHKSQWRVIEDMKITKESEE